jgi:oxygen-independent coproporphyrinogen-3 oxidase
VHDRAQALAAVAAARAAGFDNLNLDLMHGLPGQDLAAGLEDLATAIALGPEHLSWYQLTIEPNTVFHRRPPLLPGEAILGDLESEGTKRLEAAVYGRYEVSAWSRPGRHCRHNLNYWTFGDYLAIGAGAHGKVTGADGRVRRYAKRRQPDAYLDAGTGHFTASERYLDAAELAGEFMLNALRLVEGVPRSRFAEATALDDAAIAATVAALVEKGLLRDDPAHLGTTPLGLTFLDDVVGAFFAD